MLDVARKVAMFCLIAGLAFLVEFFVFGAVKNAGYVFIPLVLWMFIQLVFWSRETRRLVCPDCNREVTASSPERYPCSKCGIIWRTDTMFGIGEYFPCTIVRQLP
ncbi:MAG: hypothetical protein AAF456_24320 [Planctomycetota bacterium]